MKGIIYTRVSSDEQVKGTSLEFQEELCRKYCEQKGIEIVSVFREEGESAKDLSLNNRKKFLEALEFCRKSKGTIQSFVVLRVDRFARNTEDHFAVRKILLDYGVSLHSVTEPIGNKPAEKFIETVLAGAAEYDNAIRKQRCTDGMIARINQGIYPWKPPIGYKCLHFKKQGEKKTQPDPPDEKLFPIIQKGLQHFAKGTCSQAELTRLLDTWGLQEIRNQKTTLQFVDRILGRYLKFYAGIIVNPWTGEEKEGLHKPMITKGEMYQIQLIRSGKIKMVKRERFNPEFPLRRTVLCSSCSYPLTGSISRGNGGKYPYYHCHKKNCPMYGKAIAKRDLERDFVEYLKRIAPKRKFLVIFKETILELWNDMKNKFSLRAQNYERQIALLEEKRKRIFEMREEGSYTKEEFLERKQEIEEELAANRMSLCGKTLDDFDIQGALSYAIGFIQDFGRQWMKLSYRLRTRFQKILFPDGISYERGKGFGTAKMSLIYELNRRCDGDLSQMVHFLQTDWNHIIEELKAWQELKNEVEREKSYDIAA